MRKLLTVLLAALFAGATLVACDRLPQQPADTQGPEARTSQEAVPPGMMAEEVWGNDHLWRQLVPKTVAARLENSEGVMPFGSPADPASYVPVYLIGPEAGDDGAQAAHGIGPHDHVRPVPPGNGGSFSASCNLRAAFAAPGGDVSSSGPGLAHAADTDGDGSLEELTSAQKVKDAAALGNVVIQLSPITFTCPVRDIEG